MKLCKSAPSEVCPPPPPPPPDDLMRLQRHAPAPEVIKLQPPLVSSTYTEGGTGGEIRGYETVLHTSGDRYFVAYIHRRAKAGLGEYKALYGWNGSDEWVEIWRLMDDWGSSEGLKRKWLPNLVREPTSSIRDAEKRVPPEFLSWNYINPTDAWGS